MVPSFFRARRKKGTITWAHLVLRCDNGRAVPPRFAWRAPRRAAASRQQGLTTLTVKQGTPRSVLRHGSAADVAAADVAAHFHVENVPQRQATDQCLIFRN